MAALAVIFAGVAGAQAGSCGPAVFGAAPGGGCFKWDLSTLPHTSYTVNDSFPEPYLVASPPCSAVSSAGCSACSGATAAVALQLDPAGGCGAKRCIPLGTPTTSTVTPIESPVGVEIAFTGGADGRTFTYRLVCNRSAVGTAPEAVAEGPTMHYTVTWETAAGCSQPAPASSCRGPPPPPLARPTPAQLNWMNDEIGAIGHFNMGTFEGCGIGDSWMEGPMPTSGISLPPPSTFAPQNVDVESWVKALASFGARRAVLVVSHGCGFNTFPSNTAFPEFDFVYNYSVKSSPWMGGKGDIAKLFVDACRSFGIQPGFYHGAMNNAFLNVRSGKVGTEWIPGQARITQDQYTQVLLANLRQLWTDYGPLTEVWFDGGFPPNTADPIAKLLAELQPQAVAFQGPGDSVIRWAGTEGGHVSEPFWSAAASSLAAGKGDPQGAVFSPAEADTCFQGGAAQSTRGGPSVQGPYGGCWFYNAGMNPKSLEELVSSYHDTVGHNAFWLLDWTPNQTGMLRPDHVARYAELGSWLTTCYGASVATLTNASVTPAAASVTLSVPAGKDVDRVVIKEDQTHGQQIVGFTVGVSGASAPAITGQSIGNRFIGFLPSVVTGPATITVNVTATAGPTTLREVSLFNCSRTPARGGCSFVRNFAYTIVPSITVVSQKVSSVEACCSLCSAHPECAVFVQDGAGLCTVMSANQGGAAATGATSGSPL
eukprot:m.55999 g.55999  ORF g.55999 m.55999 type:complete len:711 (+) comp9286_c0_seq2:153-2285(+)